MDVNRATPASWFPQLEEYLERADRVITNHHGESPVFSEPVQGNLRVGVDLGTAYLVLVVLDESGRPIAGEYQFASVVRDGLVVDYWGAVELLRGMKQRVEHRIKRTLTHAASGFPPGVPQAEVRSTANVVEAGGFICTGLIDEPSAANNLLAIRDGAIVDVGGGTTGIAVIQDRRIVYTADEATGGTHFSLVIAGALNISFEEAEARKIDPHLQTELFPVVRPVMEKVGTIAQRHLKGFSVPKITLVGGSTAFPGMAGVIQEITGIPTTVPTRPLFITPIGIAMHDQLEEP